MLYIIFSECRNYLEREKLLDRVMAKDYQEYAGLEIQKKEYGKVRLDTNFKTKNIPL
tara:strand:- start:1 stop:171 length:171 start_codon:yes stop_codon:yes gene_type:complete